MILFKKSRELQDYILKKKSENLQIGFVPTMGALHAGHLSLISSAKRENDIVICSIFVNPTQFNQANDLANYPKPIENDIKLLVQTGCDILFLPTVDELYHGNLSKESSDDYGDFIHVLEGKSRPGHFDGVVTIVAKFFRIVSPHQVYFGQKDYQQCLVVQTLISREFPTIKFNLCPIARELDGLAMSSRNIRLSEAERNIAGKIYMALNHVSQNWNELKWMQAKEEAINQFLAEPFELEYFSICDRGTLKELTQFRKEAVVLVAARLGETRLIDNMILG